jgi:RES domain-containing protein
VTLAAFSGMPTWRVVATRHPPIALFETVAPSEDFEALQALEAAHSAHYDDVTLLLALPRTEWVSGPGSGYVMAPFAYRSPSRFSDGSFGVYYAGLDETTSIREVAFHRGRFLAATAEPPCVLEEQILKAQVTGDLEDLREAWPAHPEWSAPSPRDYAAAQSLGTRLREQGATGLLYPSVRNPGGNCVGILRPRAVSRCRQVRALKILWDGEAIAGWA